MSELPDQERLGNRLMLWVAQGFGSGRMPVAPGTFGTIPGLLWALVLLQTGRVDWFLVLTLLGLGASVYLCGRAEELLNSRDPGSVVLDEIAAMPVCFLPFIRPVSGGWEFSSSWIWSTRGLLILCTAFGLFRLFDIWKPWPVRQSQRLPRGWGVTMDDFLAAVYSAAVLAVIFQR